MNAKKMVYINGRKASKADRARLEKRTTTGDGAHDESGRNSN